MQKTIILDGKSYLLKKLSATDALECISLEKQFRKEFAPKDADPKLTEALCENAVLGYFCVFDDGKKAFSSPLEVLKTLSLDAIATIYEEYCAFSEEQSHTIEYSVNESYGKYTQKGEVAAVASV